MSAPPAFIGRYEIRQRLGQGGMGVIYLARDPAIDRLVALKLLNADIATDELRQRFAQEARSSGGLSHPHIVTLHDFGEVTGVPYLVMEYVEGETVAALIKRAAPIPVTRKLEWIEQACRALGYAHQRRVIHRDIKPSNLMIDQFETLKVVDFGIARSLDGATTKMSMVIGTPGYMSPEQIQGGGIDARSDIFALGTVLYELLAYREAFAGDNPHAIMNQVVSGQPQPLSELLTGADLSIAAVVDRALQKSPDARFEDMAQFEAAVKQVRIALVKSGRELTLTAPRRAANDRNQSRRRPTDPFDLARRRAEQIARHLVDARRARQAGDIEAAIIACENALLMDPSSVEALELVEELRQESTGPLPRIAEPTTLTRATPPIATSVATAQTAATPVATPPVAARQAPAAPVRFTDLSQIELRRGAPPDQSTNTVLAGALEAGSRPAPSARASWPWAVAIVVVAAGALGVWAVQSGLVARDQVGVANEPVELAMPTAPQTDPAPRPGTSPPPLAGDAPAPAPTAPSQAAEGPSAEAGPEAAPAKPSSDTVPDTPPESPPVDATAPQGLPAATPDRAPSEQPRDVPPPSERGPEPPPAAAVEPSDDGDREAIASLLLRGEGAERNGNLAEALAYYREVLKLNGGNTIALRAVLRIRVATLLRRAESLILDGNYDAALKVLGEVEAYDLANTRVEELREAVEQGRNTPARKKPGS